MTPFYKKHRPTPIDTDVYGDPFSITYDPDHACMHIRRVSDQRSRVVKNTFTKAYREARKEYRDICNAKGHIQYKGHVEDEGYVIGYYSWVYKEYNRLRNKPESEEFKHFVARMKRKGVPVVPHEPPVLGPFDLISEDDLSSIIKKQACIDKISQRNEWPTYIDTQKVKRSRT